MKVSKTVRIEGLSELDAALGALPKATAKAVLRRALRKAAKPIEESGRNNAPLGPTGNLKNSYGTGTKLTRRQARMHRKMFKDDKASAEMFVGPNDPADIQTEFGNAHQQAEPHLRPAWDANKDRALNVIKEELGAEIMKAAKRLAKKAAKGR